MSGRCTICRHPQHEAITVSAIRNGLRPTARTFQVSLPALYRHKGHLPRTLVKAGQAQEVTSANSLLAEVTDLMSGCRTIAPRRMQHNNGRRPRAPSGKSEAVSNYWPGWRVRCGR